MFNINGAHGQVYHPLIKALKIPALIITDLDIERSDEENFQSEGDKKTQIYTQISSLIDRISTNSTIHKFNGTDSEGLENYINSHNLYGVFQKEPINGFYATSFEEAFILTNSANEILNAALKKVKRNKYYSIVGKENPNTSLLNENSYMLQNKLSNSKTDFANTLLYQMITREEGTELPTLPSYILDGLNWLQNEVIKSLQGEEG